MAVPTKQPDNNTEEVGWGRRLILLALVGVAAYLIYTIFIGDGPLESSIPKAMQVTYRPAEFKINLDETQTLAILSDPQRYKNEFDALILTVNSNLLMHVANRMGLDGGVKSAVLAEYKKMHPYIRQMYFNDFIGLSDTTSNLFQTWYENRNASAVELLNEVASKYTCFFVTNVLATVLRTQDGKVSVKGSKVETPCGIALAEGLRPLVHRLSETAAVRDFSAARGLMRERVERAVTELAVIEVRDRKGIRVDNSTKIWKLNVSTTSVDITALSIMKVGFNLQNFFDLTVDSRTRTVVVTLPPPQILSHEVHPKVENLDIGWARDLSSADFNDNIRKLQAAFKQDANETAVFDKAKTRAKEVMELILSPMVKNIDKKYKIEVRFKENTAWKG